MSTTALTSVGDSLDGRSAADLDPEADGLIEDSRERRPQPLGRTERLASLVVGGSFFVVAIPFGLLAGSSRQPSLWTVLVLVAAYAAASKVEFEIGAGFAVPTELVLVPMLFLLPIGWVPVVVVAGLVLGEVVGRRFRKEHFERLAVVPGNAWHALGPALVLAAAGESAPTLSDWPLYVAAFGAQIAFDYTSSAAREWIAFRLQPRSHLRFMVWVWMVDGALAPVGLAIAMSADTGAQAVLFLAPLVALLAVFARHRRVAIDRALELSHAYRGTAFLLGDVVEADDSYTGAHCRDVVELSVAVAERLGLDARGRRDTELVALLHDVGKVRIPKELINKPGVLTHEERALMETHAIKGEEMLSQVGGLLGEVGRVVRSHHERWDGKGYPDSLAGKQIPLIARIVSCCDAFNAMTTDRPYRRALPLETAVAELEAQSGAQFDPTVVATLVAIINESKPAATRPGEPGSSIE
jgi:HD-GYP domain-containing protein (c-di-GMP phosphodiesterase class II)